MTESRTWKPKDAKKLLERNGFSIQRTRGSHQIFKRGSETISLPSQNVNPMLMRRLIKEHNLAVA